MNQIITNSPIMLISFFAITSIVVDALFKNRKLSYDYSLLGILLTLIASVYTLTIPAELSKEAFVLDKFTNGMIRFGDYSAFFDSIFCIAGFLTLISSRNYLKIDEEKNEYYSLYLFALSGMMLISHSSNLLVLFLGIEIMSISFYVLTGYFRKNEFSIEAAIKYFLLGSFATAFLVFGMSLLYGSTTSLDLTIIHNKILSGNFNPYYLTISIALLSIGLSFKASIFPFHQWAPDVYNGAPTPVTAFMSTAGKAAAFAGFIIIAKAVFISDFELTSKLPGLDTLNVINQSLKTTHTIKIIIALMAAATMLLGNITALAQKNIKRMLAYSSVAHAGYLLMGIVADNPEGWKGIIFYATAYTFMQIGAFIIISYFEKNKENNLNIEDYSGLRKSHPYMAAAMAIFMLSLTGIPPFAGFFGKYYLFVATIKADFIWLTVVAVISSIISMYYYIGLIVNMYFRDSDQTLSVEGKSPALPILISVAALFVFGIFPSLITDIIGNFFK